jgi:hypothetical protein
VTAGFILIVTLAVLGWEALALRSGSDGIVTISEAVVIACRKHLWILVLIGAVLGHWFWSYCPSTC